MVMALLVNELQIYWRNDIIVCYIQSLNEAIAFDVIIIGEKYEL